ncbi:hypothetical protein EMCRGX_G020020 [Ephydatia muelleri]
MPTSQAAPNVTALNAVTALSNPNSLLIHTCGPSSPLILNTNFSSMSLQWNAPLQPEYVITAYTLHHRVPSLKSQSEMWGPPSMATVQFHTYNPSSILFHQINSVVTDFLGVKLHGGLPWLIFDVGSGPAVVVSNSTRTFNDGQWHTGYVVLFEQASNTFYVTVDTVHMAAITADHETPDGFDAVPVQNVGSTYMIVSWDLPTDSNGILINFSLYCNGALAGVLPLTVISYNTTGLLPFTLYMYMSSSHAHRHCTPVGMGVISAAASLPRPYGGAYSHSPIPQLEQDVGMGHVFPPLPPQTGNPGSITEIECTLLSGSAEQDALTMKESPLKNLIPFFLRPHPSWGWLQND